MCVLLMVVVLASDTPVAVFFWEKLLRMRKQEANIQHAIHWDDGPLQISDWIECIQ